MPVLTIRHDLPTFKHGFLYEGDKAHRAKLKASIRELTGEGGMDLESFVAQVIAGGSKYLTQGSRLDQQGAMRFVTAGALDLPSGHPTHPGTIDEYLDGYDFLVTITNIVLGKNGKIDWRIKAFFNKDVRTA
jgi:hypothetical protein